VGPQRTDGAKEGLRPKRRPFFILLSPSPVRGLVAPTRRGACMLLAFAEVTVRNRHWQRPGGRETATESGVWGPEAYGKLPAIQKRGGRGD